MRKLASVGSVLMMGVLLACALPVQLFAQADRGTITGTVADPTGAVIPGVEVVTTNVETGVTTKATTNSLGLYSILNLPVGRYSVSFSRNGFRTITRSGLSLAVAQVLSLDINLEVGATSEVMNVTAEGEVLQTQTSDMGTNLKHSVVSDLPLSVDGGRRLELFAYKTTPGVEGNDWESYIAGSAAFTKEVMIDGTSTNATIQGDLMESSPSMDAVEEFQVQTSGFSAENGRTGGGVFMFNLKSGTNKWHGTASLFLHESAFDASSWNNGWKRQLGLPVSNSGSFHDYAFSGGGPIIKNKTFFYVAYEKFNQKDFRLASGLGQTVPIPAFLTGDFSALLDRNTPLGTDTAGNTVYKGAIFDPNTRTVFPNNVIPSGRISAVAKQIAALYQKYYAPVGSGLFNNNALTLGNSPAQTPTELSYKVDHNFSEKNRLSTSWIYNLRPRTLVDAGGIWAAGTEDGGPLAKARRQDVIGNQWRASDSHSFTPNVLHVFSATYNEYKNASRSLATGGGWPAVLGFGSTGAGNFPEIDFGANRNGWNESPIGYAQGGGYLGDTFILDDAVTWVKGRHTMKFGGDFRAMQINSKSAAGAMHFNFSPDQTGNPSAKYANQVGFGFASMMLGAVQKASMDTPFELYGRRKYMALFAQDDWKVDNRLTLNLGLRWETTFPFHEKFGHWGNFNQALMNPTWGIPGTLVFADGGGTSFEKNRDWLEFAPHLGFAYRATDKLVARGSYSITYVPMGTDYWFGVPYGFAPGFRGTNQVPGKGTNPAFNWDSGYPGQFVPANKDPNNIPWGPVSVDPDSLKLGYIHQFFGGVQYELSKDTKIDLSYMGNRGRRLHSGNLDYNQLDATTYFNWYGKYSAHAYDWVWDAPTAAAAGVPWYPANPYGAYMAYQAMSKFPQVSMLYGPLYYVGTPKGLSTYNALQVEFTKRGGHGVTTDFSYIYSASRGNVESNFDELWPDQGVFQDYARVNQDANTLLPYDLKHVFKGYVTYALPFGRGQQFLGSAGKALDALVGGWKIGAVLKYTSGTPITLSSNNYYPGWATVYPNVNTGANFSSQFNRSSFDPTNGSAVGNQYFSTGVASNPPNGTLGTGPVRLDALRGFGHQWEDASLMKSFAFGADGRYRLSARFQMYNIFNRHYYDDPSGAVGTANFGKVTGIYAGTDYPAGPRQGQFDIRFQF